MTDSTEPNALDQGTEALARLLGDLEVDYSPGIVGEDYIMCHELTKNIVSRYSSPSEAVQVVATIVDGLIGERERNPAIYTLAESTTTHHQQGLERRTAELPDTLVAGHESDDDLRLLAVLDHKLKRELSAVYTDTLYSQGFLDVDPETYVAEYLARCGTAAIFLNTDRRVKPDISGVVINEDSFLVERARMILPWAQKHPEKLPATWDEWHQPYNDLRETKELDIDLPPTLIEALVDHPNDHVRGVLAVSQILTPAQLARALSHFTDTPYGGGMPKAELNIDGILKAQYSLRRTRLVATPEEAHQAVQPMEEFLGVSLSLGNDGSDDRKLERPFNHQLGDRDGLMVQGIGHLSTLGALYDTRVDRLEEIDETRRRIDKARRTQVKS